LRKSTAAALLALALPLAAPAAAQTRLDVVASGEVTRVPDIVRIDAGVVTQATSAVEAIRLNAQRMVAVRAALRGAGIADRDIQTSNISLQADYRYAENRPPVLTGYRASNQVNVRFRDIANSGQILDALVAQGANQINGPNLAIEHPEAALDEARLAALANARARAELYARPLGLQVRRILVISEAGAAALPPMPAMRMQAADAAQTRIDPGEQTVGVTLTVSFELGEGS
jgi:uncharacterized protein YggE